MSQLLASLRQLSARRVGGLALSNGAMLAWALLSGWPYLVLQLLLGLEVLLMSLATIPLYPERGLLRHAADLLKLAAGLAFVGLFVLVSYGVAADGDGHAVALETALASVSTLGRREIAAAVAYLAASMGWSLWQAWHSSDPRLTWSKTRLGTGAAAFLSLFCIVFVAIFAVAPLRHALILAGLDCSADRLLILAMALLRFLFGLLLATFSEEEWINMARHPYVEPPR